MPCKRIYPAIALFVSACSSPAIFDISSSVLVQDKEGANIQSAGADFCYSFESGDPNTLEIWTAVHQCTTAEVNNGLALLPNLEGQFYGEPLSVSLVLLHDEQQYSGVLLDDDSDVWCDNVDVDHDAEGNVTKTPFCTYGYEFYQLWSVAVPTGVMSTGTPSGNE